MDFPPIPNCRQRSLVSSGFLSKANPHTFPSTRGMFVRRRVDVAVGYCKLCYQPQVAINLWMWSIHSFASYFALWVGLAAHAGQFRVTVVKGWLRANRAAVRRKWGRGDGHIPWCAIFNKRFFQALKHCLSRYTFGTDCNPNPRFPRSRPDCCCSLLQRCKSLDKTSAS